MGKAVYNPCTMTRKGGINKTRKAVAKRFKVTGTGKVLRRKQGKRHILQKKSSKRKRNAVPLGNQMGKPLPTISENIKSSNSLPILRWSRFLASSRSARYSSSIFFFGKVIP